MSERSPFELRSLEHGLDCAARTFRRTSRSTSLLRNTPSSSPGSILERGYLPTPLRPPRLVRWCTKGRALRMCEESLSSDFRGRRFSSSFPPGYFLTASRVEAAKLFVDALARSTMVLRRLQTITRLTRDA